MRYTVNTDELTGLLRQRLLTRRLSVRQAARAAGVSDVTLSRILRGVQVPDFNTLHLLARWLEVSVENLTSGSGIVDPVQPEGDRREQGLYMPETVARLLRGDRQLNPEDAETLTVAFRVLYDNFLARKKDLDNSEPETPSLDAQEMSS